MPWAMPMKRQTDGPGCVYYKNGKDIFLLICLTRWEAYLRTDRLKGRRKPPIPGLQDLSGEIEGALVGSVRPNELVQMDFRSRRDEFVLGGPAYLDLQVLPGRVFGRFQAAGVWKWFPQ